MLIPGSPGVEIAGNDAARPGASFCEVSAPNSSTTPSCGLFKSTSFFREHQSFDKKSAFFSEVVLGSRAGPRVVCSGRGAASAKFRVGRERGASLRSVGQTIKRVAKSFKTMAQNFQKRGTKSFKTDAPKFF